MRGRKEDSPLEEQRKRELYKRMRQMTGWNFGLSDAMGRARCRYREEEVVMPTKLRIDEQ